MAKRTLDGVDFELHGAGPRAWGFDGNAWAEAVTSALNGRPSRGSVVINPRNEPYGAQGDGSDDTQALQLALDALSAAQYTGESTDGVLYLPRGVYNTSDLNFYGSAGGGIRIVGDNGASAGSDSGTVLRYTGSNGGTMLSLRGLCGSSFRDIRFDGNSKAKHVVHAQERRAANDALINGSSSLIFENCWFYAPQAVADSVLFAAGSASPGNLQASEMYFYNSYFRGNSSVPGAGFQALTGANCKNFFFILCQFSNLTYGVDALSGTVHLVHPSFGGIGKTGTPGTCVRMLSGNSVVLDGFSFESDVGTESRLLHTDNGVAATIKGGYVGALAPDDDYIIKVGGPTDIAGVSFEFNRRSGSNTQKIQLTTTAASLSVKGCGIQTNSTALNHFPVYDGNGNDLFLSDYGRTTKHNVVCEGNMQNNVSDGVYAPLPDERGRPTFVKTGAFAEVGIEPGLTVEQYDGCYMVTIPRTVWRIAGTTQTIAVGYAPGLSKIETVVPDTTAAYSGLAGTIQLEVGIDTDPDAFILAHDVKSTPVTKGLADADLGVKLARANATQGGYFVPKDVTRYLYVTLTSSNGNIGTGAATNLLTGSTKVIFHYRPAPI